MLILDTTAMPKVVVVHHDQPCCSVDGRGYVHRRTLFHERRIQHDETQTTPNNQPECL